MVSAARASKYRVRPVSSYLVYAGLFTVSWDRIFGVDIGSFNLKVPTICFALALVLTLADSLFLRRRLAGTDQRIIPILIWTVFLYLVAGMLSVLPVAAVLQVVTVVLGAVVPFAAVYLNVRLYQNLDGALTAFIRGGIVAAVFGVYQFAAAILGLPQIVTYNALGGGAPRISSFLYESGYFGYFMVLVIAAYVARARLRGIHPKLWVMIAIFAILLLANTRAAYLTAPLLIFLLWWRRPKKVGIVVVIAALLVYAGVLVALIAPDVYAFLWERASSILDPNEVTSNAPRLEGFDRATEIALDHPWFGIGAGNLIHYSGIYGGTPGLDASSNSVIANNAYLQAALDGGIVQLLMQLIIGVKIAVTAYRRQFPVARALASGWIAVALVAFVGTSYYWDMKLWVVAALAFATVSLASRESGSEPVSALSRDATSSR